MRISQKQLLFSVLCFLFFLGLFLLPQKTFSAQLEVNYPEITDASGAKLTIGPGTDLPNYLKYVFTFGIFAGFFAVLLSLIWAGVLYLLSPAIPSALAQAKDRVGGAISGLLILALLYLVIATINPDLALFKLKKIDPAPQPPPPGVPAGVRLFSSTDCSGESQSQTASILNLDNKLNNLVNSANIVQDPKNNIFYIALLYDLANFSGKCKYINPCKDNNCQESGCQDPETINGKTKMPFAESATIAQFDGSPNGDGVYFYRKSFFDETGGWQKISNAEIVNAMSAGKLYVKKLESLTFNQNPSSESPNGCTVPANEQDCIGWDELGNCVQKKCPNLGGENITSIKIKGNYIVLLVYFDELNDTVPGPWTFCKAFPTKDDVVKNGPNQVKWENIRNRAADFPNYMIIIPVKQK